MWGVEDNFDNIPVQGEDDTDSVKVDKVNHENKVKIREKKLCMLYLQYLKLIICAAPIGTFWSFK